MIASTLPLLYVEGKDDVSVVSALLKRHGLDTERGKKYLYIKDSRNWEGVLDSIPEGLKRAPTGRSAS